MPRCPKSLVVVGAGYIGLELGIAFRKLGAEVTIVEAADRILPRYDEALTRPVRRWLTRNGVTLHLGATVTGRDGDGRLADRNRLRSRWRSTRTKSWSRSAAGR